ncbi:hypothetical protein PCASD_07532 [Puccinia coronata f. sp. avenae]|uniref:Uncharacterized protein n=1 Tax=Puccinia coronata f. sp. avenae TaxID=200324 RepID=A0A2N5V0K7_9BASI|nr:hypothetical protein PCASD_07532 [Puccinia coronata f. sp. avenae]
MSLPSAAAPSASSGTAVNPFLVTSSPITGSIITNSAGKSFIYLDPSYPPPTFTLSAPAFNPRNAPAAMFPPGLANNWPKSLVRDPPVDVQALAQNTLLPASPVTKAHPYLVAPRYTTQPKSPLFVSGPELPAGTNSPAYIPDPHFVLQANRAYVGDFARPVPEPCVYNHLTPPYVDRLPVASVAKTALVDAPDNAAAPTPEHAPVTYPFTNLPRVEFPSPCGIYDVDNYHMLESYQIKSLLNRTPDPTRFDHYAFAPQQFPDFYQLCAMAFVGLCNQNPTRDPAERANCVNYFKLITCCFHSLDRVVCC